MTGPPGRRRVIVAPAFGAVAGAALVLLAGCGATPAAATDAAAPPATAITHIHAAVRNPATGDLLLATHHGLFRKSGDDLRQLGPAIDLMGFAVGPDGTFYASGHPGAGVDLPQPVGLITSTDSGRTWQVASLGGAADFHALAAGPSGVAGFDGAMRVSKDGKTWETRTIPAAPRSLAASPETGTLLAATEAGLLLSNGGVAGWRTLTPPEPATLAAWADERTIAVATSEGNLAISSDGGTTWTRGPKPLGAIDTLSARRDDAGRIEIIVSVDQKVLQTTDAGATVETLLP